MKYPILSIFIVFISLLIQKTGKSQPDSIYTILVAGHAYGAHAGTNIGLHPPLLEKLKTNVDSTVLGIFLTGDIVNYSTFESWNQVATELNELSLPSYYVMGNHDDNSLGKSVFQEKHGGTYYSFIHHHDLYIILNSTESDRSISPEQLDFMENILTNTDSNWNRAFIFFHEIIWNSHERYKLVRSNSRSRYDQMEDHSNFWNEVFPMLTALSDKEFYLFAGDVGGNPDAIAASYDKWENVTLLSSGMGEVVDENFLKAEILPDTIKFTLVPLRENVEMKSITWYNLPEAPTEIQGPMKVAPPFENVKYQVSPVFNATSYQWNLSDGMTGSSDSVSVILDFDKDFKSGLLSVKAVNDGFGVSEPALLEVKKDSLTFLDENANDKKFKVTQNGQEIQISFRSENRGKALLRLHELDGRIIYSNEFQLKPGLNSKIIYKRQLRNEIVISTLVTREAKFVQKIKIF